MARMIFINLPVTDLPSATAFYQSIGLRKEAAFSNEKASMMVWDEVIHVMLLTRDYFATFTPKEIADAHRTAQVALCVSAEDKAGVDALVDSAGRAGGEMDPGPKQEMGEFMYGRSFADLDGHHWEVMWMDVSGMQAASAEPVEA
ncbi:VOC family protein [Sphingomonas sp. LHG3406-1]|uniref:VOC family protein n=1 Tax=Sphingomonas sp. LHG3406-1 TaxID=2804617 RepID=UPI0026295795|nr:VOC family protein [Sphingomonas sp. LHG3406-1]